MIKAETIEKEQATDVYPVLPTVLFTEDDWNTTYEGCIMESSIYSHKIRSQVYGIFWIPKENVRLKNGG
jgi:hypothetical protein